MIGEAIQQNAPPGAVPLYLVATIYLELDEQEQALAMLTQAVALREEGIIWLKVDPQLDPLRGEARFEGASATEAVELVQGVADGDVLLRGVVGTVRAGTAARLISR